MLRCALLLLAVAPSVVPRAAQAVEAHYEAYAAGLNVVAMDASIDLSPDTYHVRLDYRTVGGLSLVLSSHQDTRVDGRFEGPRAIPDRFFSTGILRGSQRVTQIDYPKRPGPPQPGPSQPGPPQPVVRQLVPANETEREPVPQERQADTIDTLSAMAELVHQVNTTGRCDGRVTTFDGRRLSILEARTAGPQLLEPSGRSSFSGMTLRCEFTGRQQAGFMLDEDRERLARPQQGTAWFAATVPGGPKIPVRIAFQTRWFGEATMYLAAK